MLSVRNTQLFVLILLGPKPSSRPECCPSSIEPVASLPLRTTSGGPKGGKGSRGDTGPSLLKT